MKSEGAATRVATCACRDCFEIATAPRDLQHRADAADLGNDPPSLCRACEIAGCSIDGDADCAVGEDLDEGPDDVEDNENGPGGLYQIGGA